MVVGLCHRELKKKKKKERKKERIKQREDVEGAKC
jgi:hypothetical protein